MPGLSGCEASEQFWPLGLLLLVPRFAIGQKSGRLSTSASVTPFQIALTFSRGQARFSRI